MSKDKPLKKFVVKKYVWATSAIEAIKHEHHVQVDDVWIDDDWKKSQPLPKAGDNLGYGK